MTHGGNVAVFDWAPSPFVDVVKSSRGFGKPDEWDENPKLARDAQGWPAEPSRILITATSERPGTEWPTGVWKGRWRGAGNLVHSPISGGTISKVERKGDVVTFDWTVTATPFLSLSFDGPIRDLRIVRPGFDLDNHPLLHPAALDYYKQFHTLRFLDFMGLNSSVADSEATWAQRQPAGKWHGRKSWEAMAEFFTAVHSATNSRTRNAWIVVPFRFSEADCLALATRLHEMLPAEAGKFFEFANELWNLWYGAQWNHFLARANNPLDPDYATVAVDGADQWTRVARVWGLGAARAARASRRALGSKAMPVLAGQFWNPDLTSRQLKFLATPPMVAEFGTRLFTSLSAAPYLQDETKDGVNMHNATTPEQLLSRLRAGGSHGLDKIPAQAALWKSYQTSYSIPRLDAYEWQLHTHEESNHAVKLAANLHEAAGVLVRDMAIALDTAGFDSAQFHTISPQVPDLPKVNSFAWSLDTAFAGAPSTPKAKAVFALAAEANK